MNETESVNKTENSLCENFFRNTEKSIIGKEYTKKWIEIICRVEREKTIFLAKSDDKI